MIKLSEETKAIIAFAVKYCGLVKIDSLLIDKSGIRAKQDLTAVYLIEPGDYNFLEFDSLYITRIGSLVPRIKMFEGSKRSYDLYVDLKELDNEDTVVKQLIIKSGSTEIKFSCSTMPQKSRLPKKVNDPLYYEFDMEKDSLDILTKGVSAMGASFIKIFTEGGEIKTSVKDIEGDTLNHVMTSSFEKIHKDSEDEFNFEYDFKVMLPLLKEAAKEGDNTLNIQLTRRGIMRLTINELSMYIFPEAT